MSQPDRRLWLAVAAAVALACWLALGWHAPQQMLGGYLAAWIFFLAPVLGSVALLMVHALTGGAWGIALRDPLVAMTRVLPLLAVLLLPILVGAGSLYPWAGAHALAPDPHLAQQRWYLNLPFFWARAIVCLLAWLALARGVRHRMESAVSVPWRGFAAAGLIAYLLTISIAAVDWIMSLVPAWHSSILGMLVASGQLLVAGSAAVICVANRATAQFASNELAKTGLGKLLLAMMLGWAYLSFMGFLTAWIADLPGETVWYAPRLKTGWSALGAGLVLVGMMIPFAMLLSRRARHSLKWMRAAAIALLVAQAIDAAWLVVPSLRSGGVAFQCSDAFAWLGIGGLCWVVFRMHHRPIGENNP